MPEVKIKYVGRKEDGERAFKEQTEIEWFPGDVHAVDVKVAEQMLRHPDVFEQVSGDAVKPAKAPTLKAVAADQDEVDDDAIAREAAAKKAKEDAQSANTAPAAGSDSGAGAARPEESPKETTRKQRAKPAAKNAAKKAK